MDYAIAISSEVVCKISDLNTDEKKSWFSFVLGYTLKYEKSIIVKI